MTAAPKTRTRSAKPDDELPVETSSIDDLPFFTIGHSNRSLDDFIALLQVAEVRLLADIRKLPGSRAHPRFNEAPLSEALSACDIDYEHETALGGLRSRSREVPPVVNGHWENQSFHNYADYALTPPFQQGVELLLAHGRERRTAIMCSEAVWWRCHRRIVSDYLIANGRTVFHIMGQGRFERARLTPGAVVRPDRTIIYPAAD